MKIQEFVQGRNVQYATVFQYIKRNPAKFRGHVGRPKNIVLDDVAVQLLNEKYPYSQPVEVVQDTAAREQLQELQKKMITALETINRLQAENAELHMIQHKQEFLEQQAADKDKEMAQLKDELRREKSKTWFDKLCGK